jgi:RND family efflux transporter MFP subunit
MVEELTLRPISDYVSVSGKLEGITSVVMSSETSGRILQVNKRLGDRVAAGERLGMVENEVLRIRLEQADAGLASAQTALDNAQRNLNYAEASKAKNLISEAEYNTAFSAFKGAKAAYDGAKAGQEQARLAYDKSFLTAPESGYIANLNISAGQYISPGQPIATITDNRVLILKTGVGESQIGKLRKGQRAEITYQNSTTAYSGSVRGFGISPLAGTSTYPVEIELTQTGNLLPGMVVSAKILTTRYDDLLYTSITNIVKEYGRNYIFTIDSDGKAHKKEVVIGRIIGEYVELASGAEVGEKIVTTGSENLEDGSLVNIRQ